MNAVIYVSRLELAEFILHFHVCDCTQNNFMKISHCVVRTKQMYKLSCE
jgi:hypothetical protein